MALGIPTSGGGDFLPIVKFDARAGRFFRIDRGPNGTNPVDVTNGFTALFDFENIEVGWLKFTAGAAPDMSMVKFGQPYPARPSQDHKGGFRVIMKLDKSLGGDVREFASVAGAVVNAMNVLHEAYSVGVTSNPGKLPVVKLVATDAITMPGPGGAKNTFYAPRFEIVGWVPRPADMTGGASAASAAPAQPQMAAPAYTAPVAAAAVPQPATQASDFGFG